MTSSVVLKRLTDRLRRFKPRRLVSTPEFTLFLDKEADILEKAVQDVLNDGLRTKDISSKGKKEVSTSEMGDAIISKLQ